MLRTFLNQSHDVRQESPLEGDGSFIPMRAPGAAAINVGCRVVETPGALGSGENSLKSWKLIAILTESMYCSGRLVYQYSTREGEPEMAIGNGRHFTPDLSLVCIHHIQQHFRADN